MVRPAPLAISVALAVASLGVHSLDQRSAFDQRIAQGDIDARVDLASYLQDLGQKEAALAQLEAAAREGSAIAHRLIADHLLRSDRSLATVKQAETHYRHAASLGDTHAKRDFGAVLAGLALDSRQPADDRVILAQRAQRHLAPAAAEGDPDANWRLGHMLDRTSLLPSETDSARQLIARAADAGHAAAAYYLFAQPAPGAKPDPLRLQQAADAGHPAALAELSAIAPRDVHAAPKLPTLSRDRAPVVAETLALSPGNIQLAALQSPATVVENPEVERLTRELAAAHEEIDRLRRQRDDLAAQIETLRNQLAEFERYAKAESDAEQLNAAGIDRFSRGDQEGALPLFRAAAEAEHPAALANLAWFYLAGSIVPNDPRQAEALLIRAADAGNLTAAHNLADLYIAGTALPRNTAMARHWLTRAEAMGSVTATAQLVRLRALGS